MEPAFGERGQAAGPGGVSGEPQPRLSCVQRRRLGAARGVPTGKGRRAREPGHASRPA